MSIRNSISLAAWRLRRSGRARFLQHSHREQLRAAPASIEARSRFHVDLLEDYWSRCAGFLDAARAAGQPIGASFLAADWVLCPLIATTEATPDLRAYAAASERAALRAAWKSYEASVAKVRGVASANETAVQTALVAFASVLSAFRQPAS